MDNLVSVVIPAYNVEKYIDGCLTSIQQQTFNNWQAIIIEDGSSDNTAEVIQAVIQHDNRFRLIRQRNQGVSSARNAGLLAATGTYLAFLDGDDMWKPTFLAELVSAIEAADADLAYCGYTHLYPGGLRRKFSYPYASGHILLDVINGKTQVHIGAMLVKKDLIDQLGLLFTEGCLVGQDQEFVWKLIPHAKVQAVPRELLIYRIHSGSAITAQWQCQRHIHAIYGYKRASEQIMQLLSDVYDRQQVSCVLNERIAFKLYKFLWRMIKNGYFDEARQLLNNDEYNGYLAYLVPEKMKAIDRLKYKIVSSQQELCWKLASFF